MRIRAIAVNTFREAIRDRVLYSLIFFALLMIGSSALLGTLTIGEQVKVIKDLGLASISIFGLFIAIFVGIGLVYKEIERRTIYTIIAKPIQRYEFLVGKYLGLVLTLLVEVTVMALGFSIFVTLYEGFFDPALLKAILLTLFELMVVTAIAVLFSSFSTPALSGMFTLGCYVIGHLTEDLRNFGAASNNIAAERLTQFLYYLLPNLENFNVRGKVVHQIPVSGEYMAFAILYGLLYLSLLLLVATMIFQSRDFK